MSPVTSSDDVSARQSFWKLLLAPFVHVKKLLHLVNGAACPLLFVARLKLQRRVYQHYADTWNRNFLFGVCLHKPVSESGNFSAKKQTDIQTTRSEVTTRRICLCCLIDVQILTNQRHQHHRDTSGYTASLSWLRHTCVNQSIKFVRLYIEILVAQSSYSNQYLSCQLNHHWCIQPQSWHRWDLLADLSENIIVGTPISSTMPRY